MGRIDYPEGQDANSVGYSVNETWLFGNQYLSHVFVPLDADVREQSRQINDSAELSPAFWIYNRYFGLFYRDYGAYKCI